MAPDFRTGPEFGQTSNRPLDKAERHALVEGVVNRIINDFQQELQAIKEENKDLQQQLHHGIPLESFGLTQTCIHPKAVVHHKFIEHTKPLRLVMQYYQAYRAMELLTSNLPILKRGLT